MFYNMHTLFIMKFEFVFKENVCILFFLTPKLIDLYFTVHIVHASILKVNLLIITIGN